jgi:hypothetical protein
MLLTLAQSVGAMKEPMPQEYCHHCGGEIAEGAPSQLFPTKLPPADVRPGEPCRCGEIGQDVGPRPRISGPYDADRHRVKRPDPADGG